MARRFFSGASLEQAVLAAAQHFDTEPERIAYAVRARSHGVLNLRRKVAIEVDPTSPLLPDGEEKPWQPKLAGVTAPVGGVGTPGPSSSKEKAVEPVESSPVSRKAAGEASTGDPGSRGVRGHEDGERRRDGEGSDGTEPRARPGLGGSGSGGPGPGAPDRRTAESAHGQDGEVSPLAEPVRAEPLVEDPLDAADDALGEIADFLMFDLQWEIRQEDDESLSIDLSGEDGERVVAEDGYLMQAVEHLLPRLIRSRHGRTMQVRVDCEGFRALHEENMLALAENAAKEVRETGADRLLEPMSPGDRRLVHVALADDPSVVTESEGDGFTKRVRVSPG